MKGARSDGVFEVLGMPFIVGPQAVKPRENVIFDLGHTAGQMSVRYHSVVEGNGCLALVYDTRYEEGNQWAPPNLGDRAMDVHWSNENKQFRVASMGMQFAVGVLDVIVLVLIEEPAEIPPPPSGGDQDG
jgi:hypothetical protein